MEDRYIDLIRSLAADPPETAEDAERIVGLALSAEGPEGGEWFEGKGRTRFGLEIAHAEFRPAKRSRLFVLRLPTEGAPSKSAVDAAFPGAVLFDVPRGRSENEEAGYLLRTDWGQIAFGYPVPSPDVLRTVSIDLKDDPAE